MQIVTVAAVAPMQQTELRPGATIRQSLLAEDASDGLNFRLFRSQYLSGAAAFESPRHRHAFQQVRWTESGSVNYGPGENIPEGDIAYFPRGAHYGPQRKDHGVGWLLQLGFNGEQQSGPKWDSLREPAIQRLKARGSIERGMFVERDAVSGKSIEMDIAQALYQERYTMHTNQQFVVPEPRYASPVLMHTQVFDYFPVKPGIEAKCLGRFFDYPGLHADLSISTMRFSGNASHGLAAERAQIGWAKQAGLRVGGETYPAMTCFYSPRFEEHAVSGVQGLEIFLLEMPRLD